MAKDIHSHPFDDGTKIKLELFRLYIRSWLPVFVERGSRKIEIVDFFAGEGSDIVGNPGSPLLILEEIKTYCSKFKSAGTEVNLHFNDVSQKKIKHLETNAIEKLKICAEDQKYGFCKSSDEANLCPFEIILHNKDFRELFQQEYTRYFRTQDVPRFLFIDQYGIKHVNQDVFHKLTGLKQVDFMFFISSNHIMRFREQPEFKAYIDGSKLDFSEKRPSECHRVVYNYYKSLIRDKKYYLGQFSIKKNNNIFGVIFGSGHPLGLKKFLDVAWNIDPLTGETNHDIDGDSIKAGQLSLDIDGDGKSNTVKKLKYYENGLMSFLRKPKSNTELYLFSLEHGISISKTNEILKELENSGKLAFTGDTRKKGGFYLNFDPQKIIIVQMK